MESSTRLLEDEFLLKSSQNENQKDVRTGKAVPEAGAVHYQQFKQGKGPKEDTKKETKKPEKEEIARPVNSQYLVYEIKRSDGSVIYVPVL